MQNQIVSSGGATPVLSLASPLLFPGPVTFAASGSSSPAFTIPSGVAPVTPSSGNFWVTNGKFWWQNGSKTVAFLTTDDAPAGGGAWNALGNPFAGLSLTMGGYSTTFTYTGNSNSAFKITDTAGNPGGGILGHFTASNASLSVPWQADANGRGWRVDTAGQLTAVGSTDSGALILDGSDSGSCTLTVPASGGAVIPGSAAECDFGSRTRPFGGLFLAGTSASPGANNFHLTGSASGPRTWTLPDASDTFLGRATVDVLTNKTFDTAGAGNVLKINGKTITGVQGNSSQALLAGTISGSGAPLCTDANGNATTAGCPSGGASSGSSTSTYDPNSGSTDGFTWTDPLNDPSAGILGRFTTAGGSSMTPWQADANGAGWRVQADGALQSVGQSQSGRVTLNGAASGSCSLTTGDTAEAIQPGAAGECHLGAGGTPFRGIFWSGSSVSPESNYGVFDGSFTGARTFTFPDVSGAVTIGSATQRLTNKSLTNPTIDDGAGSAGFANAQHNHQNGANGGQLDNTSVKSAHQSGSGSKFLMTNGGTAGNCVQWGPNGAEDAGAPCGTGGGAPAGGLSLTTSGVGYFRTIQTGMEQYGGAAYSGGTAYYFGFVLPFGMKPAKAIYYNQNAAGAGKGTAFALYDSSCNKIAGTDLNKPNTGDGVNQNALTFASPVSLSPGYYYLGVSVEAGLTTQPTWITINNTNASWGWSNFINSGGSINFFTGSSPTTGSGATYTMPSSCGTRSGILSNYYPPAMYLFN
jgi:hypothetical protein